VIFILISGCISKKTGKKVTEPARMSKATFAPNEEGFINCFKVGTSLLNSKKYDLAIYNRWGMKVYSSDDAEKCWNGRVNNTGEDCPADVYLYTISLKDPIPGSKAELSGSVNLLRE